MISPVLRKRPKNSKTLKTLHPLEIIQFIHFVQEGVSKMDTPSGTAAPACSPLSRTRRRALPWLPSQPHFVRQLPRGGSQVSARGYKGR